MSLAKQINKKLDEIIRHNKEVAMVEEDFDSENFVLSDINTGEKVTKEIVLNKADEVYAQIIEDLNKLTNDGKNAKDLFTNQYYINDRLMDKLIADEIRENKFNEAIDKQADSNN